MTRALAIAAALALAMANAYAQQPGTGAQSPTGALEIQRGNHQFVAGPPPTVSSCGTGATIAGSDLAAIVIPQQATCLVTFANAWTSRPICTVSGETTVPSWTSTPTTLSITATVSGVPLHFQCIGQPGG